MTTPSRSEILVVDDEPQLRYLLGQCLGDAGFSVREAPDGRIALGEVALRAPDAIILDLRLPDISGLQVLQALRGICLAPVMILSVVGDEDMKVAALNDGADDYLCKPFGSRELLARLQVMLRHRASSPPEPVVRLGQIEINLHLQWASREGRQIKLTATEFQLLKLLVTDLDRVVTHRRILEELWGAPAINRIHYVRTYMARLRMKLGKDFGDRLQSESGVGYRLVGRPETLGRRHDPVTTA